MNEAFPTGASRRRPRTNGLLVLMPLMTLVVLSGAADGRVDPVADRGAPGGGPSASSPWTPEVFDYDRPRRLNIIERGESRDKPSGIRQIELAFRNIRQEPVPVTVTLPEKGKGPYPVVLLVHPLGGDRRQMTREMGKALVAKGIACVAPDLPGHGDRSNGKVEDLFAPGDPDKAYRNVVRAVMDIRQTMDLIKQREDLDSDKGVPIVGYSLGAWFGTLAGSADRRVSMLVLQAAGAGDPAAGEPEEQADLLKSDRTLLEQYPTLRVETAIREFAPRPLLMQNGRKDPFISEENARRLYRAANAPKELKWYDGGHILPEAAATDAAAWILKTRR